MSRQQGIVVHCVPLPELGQGDHDCWHDLATRAAEPNPFFEPEFLLAAAGRLDGGADARMLYVASEDGRWLACMPIRRTRIKGVLRTLSTWRHNYCFLDTPLVDAERLQEATAALIEGAIAEAHGSGVTFERLGDGGPISAAVREAAAAFEIEPAVERHFERAALRRRAGETYLEGERAHHRRDHERLWRRLEKDLGTELAIVDVAGDPNAVERFIQIERSGWKGRDGTALGSKDVDADFFRSMCRRFSDAGRLQLLDLGADGETVAMKINLVAGDAAFCFKIAHDERYQRCSPGVQLERAHVDLFHYHRPEEWLDSCAEPDNLMINRLWPDRRRITSMVLMGTGSRRALVRYGLKTAQRLQQRQGAPSHGS